jgi:hypothetical protein
MRETQMKKVLAVAVASAFVAPVALAGDVTLSGKIAYIYDIADGSQDTSNLDGDTPQFTVASSSETNQGYTVSGSMTWDGGWDGHSLAIGNTPIGTISLGDVSGALDATGDYTDIAPEQGGFGADGNDHFINVTLPSFNGVTLNVSMAPEENNAGGSENAVGASITYTNGDTSVYYGMEESKTFATADDDTEIEIDAMGIKTSVAGFYLAYEIGNLKEGANKAKYTGVAVKYSMGDVTFGMEKQEVDVEGAAFARESDDSAGDLTSSTVADADLTVAFIQYNFGGGLSSFVEVTSNDDSTTGDATAIGVTYAF